MEVRGVRFVLLLERCYEVVNDGALVGRIELHDPNIADGGLAGLLLETEGKPDGAELIEPPPPPLVTPACASAA